MKEELSDTYQDTMNAGFRQVYLTSAITAFIGILILLGYKKKRIEEV